MRTEVTVWPTPARALGAPRSYALARREFGAPEMRAWPAKALPRQSVRFQITGVLRPIAHYEVHWDWGDGDGFGDYGPAAEFTERRFNTAGKYLVMAQLRLGQTESPLLAATVTVLPLFSAHPDLTPGMRLEPQQDGRSAIILCDGGAILWEYMTSRWFPFREPAAAGHQHFASTDGLLLSLRPTLLGSHDGVIGQIAQVDDLSAKKPRVAEFLLGDGERPVGFTPGAGLLVTDWRSVAARQEARRLGLDADQPYYTRFWDHRQARPVQMTPGQLLDISAAGAGLYLCHKFARTRGYWTTSLGRYEVRRSYLDAQTCRKFSFLFREGWRSAFLSPDGEHVLMNADPGRWPVLAVVSAASGEIAAGLPQRQDPSSGPWTGWPVGWAADDELWFYTRAVDAVPEQFVRWRWPTDATEAELIIPAQAVGPQDGRRVWTAMPTLLPGPDLARPAGLAAEVVWEDGPSRMMAWLNNPGSPDAALYYVDLPRWSTDWQMAAAGGQILLAHHHSPRLDVYDVKTAAPRAGRRYDHPPLRPDVTLLPWFHGCGRLSFYGREPDRIPAVWYGMDERTLESVQLRMPTQAGDRFPDFLAEDGQLSLWELHFDDNQAPRVEGWRRLCLWDRRADELRLERLDGLPPNQWVRLEACRLGRGQFLVLGVCLDEARLEAAPPQPPDQIRLWACAYLVDYRGAARLIWERRLGPQPALACAAWWDSSSVEYHQPFRVTLAPCEPWRLILWDVDSVKTLDLRDGHVVSRFPSPLARRYGAPDYLLPLAGGRIRAAWGGTYGGLALTLGPDGRPEPDSFEPAHPSWNMSACPDEGVWMTPMLAGGSWRPL